MITITNKSFDTLSKTELYAILTLRMEIFILEQQSFYLDLDGADQHARHFMALDGDRLVAYSRVTCDGPVAHIRRVCVAKNYRNQHLGSQLMTEMLTYLSNLPIHEIELDAQIHLQAFYQKYGFQSLGAPYDDGGVMHISMRKSIE